VTIGSLSDGLLRRLDLHPPRCQIRYSLMTCLAVSDVPVTIVREDPPRRNIQLVAAPGARYLAPVLNRILPAAALAVALAGRADAETVRVRLEDNRLWLSSRGVAAPSVFAEIADRTGIRFVIDKELKLGPITIQLDGMDLERAIRHLVAAVPEAAGHTMSYAQEPDGGTRLTEVSIFGPGRSLQDGTVYEATAEASAGDTPAMLPTPDLEDRMQRMVEAGVPRDTAERVLELTTEVQKLQATPLPGSYSPDDLSPTSREQLQPLLDRGVPMERAVQMLLLQEKYQSTLKELSEVQGSLAPGVLPGSAAGAPSVHRADDPASVE